MRRRLFSIVLVLALVLCSVPAVAAAPAVCLSSQGFRVNGADVVCEKYNIDGSNYFKLRDIAYLLRETEDRFSVDYDAASGEILIVTGEDYVPIGTELDVSRGDLSASVQPGTQPLRVNGEAADCKAYFFEGYNFYRLRDLAEYLGFQVDWNAARGAAVLESSDYVFVPAAGQWAELTDERCAVLDITEADGAALTASLRLSAGDRDALEYDALRFTSADGRRYVSDSAAAAKLSLDFDGDRATIELGGESGLLVCAASPDSARRGMESADGFLRVGAETVPALGGVLRRVTPLRKVSFTDAQVEEILRTRLLPLPADLCDAPGGLRLGSVARVSDTEVFSEGYRLIFEGLSWTLCDADERCVLSADAADAVFFPSSLAQGIAAGDLLYVRIDDHVLSSLERRSGPPKAVRAEGVTIGGTFYSSRTAWVSLADVSPAELNAVIPELKRLPALKVVELMSDVGTSPWDVASVKRLQDALPDAEVRYWFDLYGKRLSTTETAEVYYDSVWIGDEGAAQVSAALDILKACKRFVLDDCGVSNWVMADLRDAHPDTKVVWRVYVNRGASMLPDETMLRLAFCVNDETSSVLQYCTEVTHLDLGHNIASEAGGSGMNDLSFLSYMPNLECVILSGSTISDISPLANCKKLVWLELCFCGWLSDISVLADHPTLRYLNISDTGVSDISALENVKLERFNCQKTRITRDQETHFVETHPDCLCVFRGENEYGYGWRYNDHGYTYFWYYQQMRDIFRYDDKDFHSNRKGA